MSSPDFFMPWYIGRYLKDTLHLTTVQHGAYCLLLMHYWVAGPLPDDDAQLAAIAKMDKRAWKGMSAVLRRFFQSKDGMLFQKRAEIERAKAETLTSDRSEAGKAGAKARWQTHRQPPDGPNGSGIANASQEHKQEHWQNDAPLTLNPKPKERTSSLGEEAARATVPQAQPTEAAVGPEAAAAVVRGIKFGLRQAHPPRAPQREKSEQIDALSAAPKLPDVSLKGTALAAARRKLA